MTALLRLFSRKPTFSDGEIDLVLSREDVRDEECGIQDGYTFYVYPAGTRRYAGYVSLRLGESPGLYYLGHIGYRIEKAYRGRHYAEKACRLLLPLLRRLRLGSVVITNNVDNIPSRKTCERLGCVLERIADVPGEYRALCAGARQKCRYIWRVPPGNEDIKKPIY
ncbi:MAG: GNAT family N-acetyltransferase [Clostridiales bacterium]|nr:GNAT family N-acetyltransferase [Clostridiales bacterium]